MQLAMSLTSYKNTIHIFKHTVVFFCLFVYFKKAANFECWDLNETLMAYQQVIFAAPSFDDSSEEKRACFLFTSQENKETNTTLPFL